VYEVWPMTPKEEDPEDDCPVSDRLCKARMLALENEIKAYKNTIYACSVTLGLVLSVLTIVLKFIKP
jgi:hypothetical protein